MCLLAIAWDTHPSYQMIFAGNRDEYHSRPTAAAHWWGSNRSVLAGKDLLAGGTWAAITREGRFAVVTNYRESRNPPDDAISRGNLVTEFIADRRTPDAFVQDKGGSLERYAGFNLLVGLIGGRTSSSMHYSSNRDTARARLEAGIHGVSNHRLNTPWPKLLRITQGMSRLIEKDRLEPHELFRLLEDRRPADDRELPATGLDVDQERLLSSPFIVNERYGTRSATIILVTRTGQVRFLEKQYNRDGNSVSLNKFAFALDHLKGR